MESTYRLPADFNQPNAGAAAAAEKPQLHRKASNESHGHGHKSPLDRRPSNPELWRKQEEGLTHPETLTEAIAHEKPAAIREEIGSLRVLDSNDKEILRIAAADVNTYNISWLRQQILLKLGRKGLHQDEDLLIYTKPGVAYADERALVDVKHHDPHLMGSVHFKLERK